MRSIDADDFISQMKDLYHRAGWDEREVHFSLQDLICNIDNMKTVGEKSEEMRLIDANRLKLNFIANTPVAFQDMVPGINAIIDAQPTVEPKPKEGEWWGDGDGYADGQIVLDMWTCSECGAIYEADEPPYKCCPNCGTRMLNYEEH